jgi:isochorismate synthase
LSGSLVQEKKTSKEEELLRWMGDAFDEGFSSVFNKHQDSPLFVKERRLDLVQTPYWIIDSTVVEDLHFIAGAEHHLLGLGVAKEWEFHPECSLSDVETALELEHISQKMARKIWRIGGWSFPSGTQFGRPRQKGAWRDFPHSRWVIPALTLSTRRNGREGNLTLAFYPDGNASPSAQKQLREYHATLAKALISPRRKPGPVPSVVKLKNQPSRKQWTSLVRRGLKSIHDGDLKKVVLARSMKILFDRYISCSTVLKKLIETNPQSTIFAIKNAEMVFMGGTPESLLSLKNGKLYVDCLASSAARGTDITTDELLGRELLRDRKSRYEHQLVVERVTKSLSAICSEIRVQKTPRVKKLPAVQHLHSIVQGHLRQDVSIWSAARTLWPTPATGGEPKDEAVRWIQEHEGIDRGWYSGVVGFVNASGDDGNFLVSIRSGVIRGDTAVLFAGNGIVPQSDPEKEFEETGWKMETMMRALTTDSS